MGAFNILKVEHSCENCKNNVRISIQYKYGSVWQFEYSIGDKIEWGGNDDGIPGAKLVVLDGISEGCPQCNAEYD